MTLQILHIGPTNVHVGPDSNSIPEAWLAWWQLDHVRTAKAVILHVHVALPQGTATLCILAGKDSLRGTPHHGHQLESTIKVVAISFYSFTKDRHACTYNVHVHVRHRGDIDVAMTTQNYQHLYLLYWPDPLPGVIHLLL